MINRRAFRSALQRWFARHGRDLPWRRTRDPYAILVSEFMLQQTQVATVIPYYQRWLERFPDFAALARAKESDVLHAWQGLGYYARARNLHAAARACMQNFGGEFPDRTRTSRALPGIGRYTAGAIASFAFDQSEPIVEANIGRVLARLTNLRNPDRDNGGPRPSLAGRHCAPAQRRRTRTQLRLDGPRCDGLPATSAALRRMSGSQFLPRPKIRRCCRSRKRNPRPSTSRSRTPSCGGATACSSSNPANAGAGCGFCRASPRRRRALRFSDSISLSLIITSRSPFSPGRDRPRLTTISDGFRSARSIACRFRRRIAARLLSCFPLKRCCTVRKSSS